MTSYLYVLSIGPVQDFIAAARRTRDLWFGSYLLSEISKAAARTIAEAGGELIFPALKARDEQLNSSGELGAFNVANIILAELPEVIKPFDMNEKAKLAAREEWKRHAIEAKEKAGPAIRKDIWNEQVDDVIEFYAAWTPMGENYKETRSRLMRLLAGRKSIRDFKLARGRPGTPKSSLDGARESVIQKGGSIPKWLSLQMRLNEGEQLCAVGLTKRLGGERVAFPSVIRVALDPWIRGIRRNPGDEANGLLDEIGKLCREGDNSFSTGTGRRLYQNFPFDGQIFYPSRLDRAKENLKDISSDSDKANPFKGDLKKLEQIEEKTIRLQRYKDGLGFGEPDPYLAILVADGDQMGKALSGIDSKEKHQKFSGQLAKFATDARRIVEDEHRGCMIYSGGDDVLAFLPVDLCLEAARCLHNAFEDDLLKAYSDQKEKGMTPTLSVGIAIGHCMEPLEDLLEFGRDAEKSAKSPDRNGLSVILHTRSGGDPIRIREQWKPPGDNGLDERLAEWVKMYQQDKFPDKAAYDLRQLAEDYRDWAEVSEELLSKDVKRLLRRKRAVRGTTEISDDDIKKLMKGVNSHDDLCRRAGELVLARSIAEVKRQTRESVHREVAT